MLKSITGYDDVPAEPKGRDKYMAVEDRREPYCDYDVIKEFFGKNTKK